MKSRRIAALVLAAMFAGLTACGDSDDDGRLEGPPEEPPPFPDISLSELAGGLTNPVHIGHAGDGSGRLFIVERRGVVRVVSDGALDEEPFLDLQAEVLSTGSEQGLLSIAFPPEFSERRRFYVVYTDQSGAVVLARYPLLPDSEAPDPNGGEALLTVPQPFANHNGGQSAFGPDGMFYLALGDGGSANDPQGNGQDVSTLLGAILRIDVEGEEAGAGYAVPEDNPLVGTAGAREEIWAYGLRNPWRFSFDRSTGDLYIADVGQNAYEEINFQPASSQGGENYGWNVMEGMHCFIPADCDTGGLTLPVAEYAHGAGDCSVTGGFVYRGERYPELQGIYVYGDFCSGRIWGLRQADDAWENELLLESGLQISAFGEDEDGELYVADYGGAVHRIEVP